MAPRDFANKPPPEPSRSRIPGWVWGFTFVAALGFVGFLVYLNQITADGDGAKAVQEEIRNRLSDKPKNATDTPKAKEPADEPPQDSGSDLDRAFEFYKLLKDDEVPVNLPEPSRQQNDTAPDAGPAQPEADKQWLIQVASFNQVADADRLRAELIINGLTEAHLTTVDLGDGGTYHRVMVGPFDNRSRLNRAQDILVELDLEVMVRTLR